MSVIGRVRVFLKQPIGAGDHARRAKAALQAVMLAKRLLHRMQRAVRIGDALDRGDLGTIGLADEHRAGLHRLAVQIDGAGAAMAGIAADMGAGQVLSCSRRKWMRSVRGSASSSTASPLIVMLTCILAIRQLPLLHGLSAALQ